MKHCSGDNITRVTLIPLSVPNHYCHIILMAAFTEKGRAGFNTGDSHEMLSEILKIRGILHSLNAQVKYI